MRIVKPIADLHIPVPNPSENEAYRLTQSILVLALTGIISAVKGHEFHIFVFYFVPVMMVAWWGKSSVPMVMMSIAAVLTWFAADEYSGRIYSLAFYKYWNASIHTIAFLLVGMVTHMAHRYLIALNDELRKAQGEVKQLRGLLPICSSCKKIRNDQGTWEAIEVYIRARSNAEFSHGICPECVKRLYPELLEEDSQ